MLTSSSTKLIVTDISLTERKDPLFYDFKTFLIPCTFLSLTNRNNQGTIGKVVYFSPLIFYKMWTFEACQHFFNYHRRVWTSDVETKLFAGMKYGVATRSLLSRVWSFRHSKRHSFMFPTLLPDIPPKQRQAFILSLDNKKKKRCKFSCSSQF